MTMLAQFSTTGGAVANYIEDVFSTWLTSGTGASQTVVNGNDFATNGGLIWEKLRGPGTQSNSLTVTALGLNKQLQTDQSGTGTSSSSSITALNTNGFTFGTAYSNSGNTNVFWSFVKKKNFYTTVTWTGNGSTQTLAHDLGSTPGCIIVKNITTAGSWIVWHRGLTSGYYIQLNGTGAQDNLNAARRFGNNSTTVDPTSTQFTVGDLINTSGDTWVALVFAHNAGGFGLTGTDNVISCGSYTGNGVTTGNNITLGFEPQWMLIKQADASGNPWRIEDTMRGMTNTSDAFLNASSSAAETPFSGAVVVPTATGFNVRSDDSAYNTSGSTYIYIAIRRGPMKVPTDATKVFAPVIRTGTGSATTQTAGFPVDLFIPKTRNGGTAFTWSDRLRGDTFLLSSGTNAENYPAYATFDNQTGINLTSYFYNNNASAEPYVNLNFARAPNFFDEVCYSAAGTTYDPLTLNHNLGVAPELYIVKPRTANNAYSYWIVGSPLLGNTYNLVLQTTGAKANNSFFTATAPTSTQFTVQYEMNTSGNTYVAYLFASCPGVSKVGTYTGTGTTQQINCGFTGGARFIMIKRTDSTGDWYVWDSARGIVAGNDPYLLLNSTAAEVTSTDYVDTYAAGFELSSTAPAALNASGGTFIFLAIA